RRHTRFSRDWSSDVCSSDLRAGAKEESSQEQYGVSFGGPIIRDVAHFFIAYEAKEISTPRTLEIGRGFSPSDLPPALREAYGTEIGRASCRERVAVAGHAGA